MAKKKPEKKQPKEKAKKQPAKPAKDELTDDQLDKVAGGTSVSLSMRKSGGDASVSGKEFLRF
jgi:hypothetical protein